MHIPTFSRIYVTEKHQCSSSIYNICNQKKHTKFIGNFFLSAAYIIVVLIKSDEYQYTRCDGNDDNAITGVSNLIKYSNMQKDAKKAYLLCMHQRANHQLLFRFIVPKATITCRNIIDCLKMGCN